MQKYNSKLKNDLTFRCYKLIVLSLKLQFKILIYLYFVSVFAFTDLSFLPVG